MSTFQSFMIKYNDRLQTKLSKGEWISHLASYEFVIYGTGANV